MILRNGSMLDGGKPHPYERRAKATIFIKILSQLPFI